MTESPYNPDFGTREEDWPDPDVDLDTEEGAEIMRRNEAAVVACMDRAFENRQRAIEEHYGNLPESLFSKELDNQAELTHEERQLLLSRGDVSAKVMAYPDSLTAGEIHEALLWPPPDVVLTNIQRATGGTLSTPSELHAKGKDALDRSQFDTLISDDEIFLMAHGFHAKDDPVYPYCPGSVLEAYYIPGAGHASMLLSRRLGLDFNVTKASGVRQAAIMGRRMEASLRSLNMVPTPSSGPREPRSQTNLHGSGRRMSRGMGRLWEGAGLEGGWNSLSQEQEELLLLQCQQEKWPGGLAVGAADGPAQDHVDERGEHDGAEENVNVLNDERHQLARLVLC
jgi:hypothetical protein